LSASRVKISLAQPGFEFIIQFIQVFDFKGDRVLVGDRLVVPDPFVVDGVRQPDSAVYRFFLE
jgi:hypothetical protein